MSNYASFSFDGQTVKTTLSTCCAAPVYVEASHMDDAERASHWYACSKCGKPCEVKR